MQIPNVNVRGIASGEALPAGQSPSQGQGLAGLFANLLRSLQAAVSESTEAALLQANGSAVAAGANSIGTLIEEAPVETEVPVLVDASIPSSAIVEEAAVLVAAVPPETGGVGNTGDSLTATRPETQPANKQVTAEAPPPQHAVASVVESEVATVKVGEASQRIPASQAQDASGELAKVTSESVSAKTDSLIPKTPGSTGDEHSGRQLQKFASRDRVPVETTTQSTPEHANGIRPVLKSIHRPVLVTAVARPSPEVRVEEPVQVQVTGKTSEPLASQAVQKPNAQAISELLKETVASGREHSGFHESLKLNQAVARPVQDHPAATAVVQTASGANETDVLLRSVREPSGKFPFLNPTGKANSELSLELGRPGVATAEGQSLLQSLAGSTRKSGVPNAPVPESAVDTSAESLASKAGIATVLEAAGEAEPKAKADKSSVAGATQPAASGRFVDAVVEADTKSAGVDASTPVAFRPSTVFDLRSGLHAVDGVGATAQQTQPDVPEVRVQRVGELVMRTVRQGDGGPERTIQVRLVPESLGEVRITIRTTEGGLDIRMAASNAAAREVLETQTAALRESLVKEGFEPGKVSVQVSTNSDQSTQQGGFNRSNEQGAHGSRSNGGESTRYAGANEPEPDSVPRRHAPLHQSALDVRA